MNDEKAAEALQNKVDNHPMKLVWVQDLDPMVMSGGAELNDRAMINTGIRRGHSIQIVVPGLNDYDIGSPDLVLFSNATKVGTQLYDELIKRDVPYAFFVHDYGPQLCRFRLLYPMEERCRNLCYLRERWLPYLQAAKTIVWLSPLHRWAWLWAYPQLSSHRHAMVPSAIDTSLFFDKKQPREGVLAVNSHELYKGWLNVKAWAEEHPEIPVTLVGTDRVPDGGPSNIKAVGAKPYGEMNDWYNKAEMFLHLPDRAGPYDRTCAEAYLAGCRVIGNKNVGAMSWPWFKKGRHEVARQLNMAPKRFWKEIEGAIA